MHTRGLVLSLCSLALVGVAGSSTAVAQPATTPATTAHSATVRVVLRPVTAAGRVAHGYLLGSERGVAADCSTADPSPGAVDPDIEFCSPSAAYAIACWKGAPPHRLLCLGLHRGHHEVFALKRTGKFAPTAVPAAADTAPLLMVLADGDHCTIRDGGAWNVRKTNPKYATYGCAHGTVWAVSDASHQGINESSSSWTVALGAASGKGKVHAVRVTKAYFVGTAS